jgi:hypothetical protein
MKDPRKTIETAADLLDEYADRAECLDPEDGGRAAVHISRLARELRAILAEPGVVRSRGCASYRGESQTIRPADLST